MEEKPGELFSKEEVERAERYHRPLYLSHLGRLLIVITAYGLLAGRGIKGLGWAGDAACWAALVTLVIAVMTLPLDYWRGSVRERRWGLSTQSVRDWFVDRAKATLISLVLVTSIWTALIAITHALPGWWPVAAATAAALLVIVFTLLAPLVLEPLFNHFQALADQHLARELADLADRARVPIRNVLVADASRRTRKSNAYVSGLGPTRRVVVWDTLLQSASHRQLKYVVAHELAHRREHHIVKATTLAVAGAVAATLLIWLALGTPQPGDYPLAALLVTALELAGMPIGAAISRRWERTADRFALELTGDRDAFIQTHLSLARSNLADLDPPRLVYLTLFTHPTPTERIASAG